MMKGRALDGGGEMRTLKGVCVQRGLRVADTRAPSIGYQACSLSFVFR